MLFIDLLGVRQLNRSRAVGEHLKALDRAVSGTYRDFLSDDSPWPAALFSDTLVLAAPAQRKEDEEAAIGGLVVQAAWLQLNLIAEGFFARGGLSFGRFHIRDGLIFGPALIEAYDLESGVAIHPRIVLGRHAERSQREDLQYYRTPEDSPQNALLLRDDDGSTFINYLGLLFDEPTDPRVEVALHRDRVVTKLIEHRAAKRIWEKYRWVAEYHNAVVEARLPQDPDLLIPVDEMTWRFSPFA